MAITPTELCDIEEIKQLKARYFRSYDTRDYELMRSVFTADARCEMSQAFDTAEAMIAHFSRRSGPRITCHHGHMPEIRIVGPNRARGIWAMYDFIESFADDPGFALPDQRGFIGYGHYLEEYRKENGVWKISFMRLTRLRSEPFFGSGRSYEEIRAASFPRLDNHWLEHA